MSSTPKNSQREVVMSVRIKKSLRDDVEKIAAMEDRTLGGQVRKILQEFVDKRKRQPN